MFDELWDDLMEYRKKQIVLINSGERKGKAGYVFCNDQGNPIEPRTFLDILRQICNKVGLDKMAISIIARKKEAGEKD